MSRRTSIVKALAEELKVIDGTGSYKTNLFNNAFPQLKFWDEVNDFPSVYVVQGNEAREHLPSGFTWAHMSVSLKVYTKGEDAQEQLEDLIEDIERVIANFSGRLSFDYPGDSTADIYVTNIVTDEGLLAPYAVCEMTLLVRYSLIL